LTAVAAGCFVTRGAFHPSRRNLQLGSFIGFLHWLVIAILYFLSDWQSTGGLGALAFSIYSGLVWLNIKVNPEHYPDTLPPKETKSATDFVLEDKEC